MYREGRARSFLGVCRGWAAVWAGLLLVGGYGPLVLLQFKKLTCFKTLFPLILQEHLTKPFSVGQRKRPLAASQKLGS